LPHWQKNLTESDGGDFSRKITEDRQKADIINSLKTYWVRITKVAFVKTIIKEEIFNF